jgi:hypothetical protein
VRPLRREKFFQVQGRKRRSSGGEATDRSYRQQRTDMGPSRRFTSRRSHSKWKPARRGYELFIWERYACHEISHLVNSGTGGWKRKIIHFTSGEEARSRPLKEDRWHITSRKLMSWRAKDWVSNVVRCEDAKW